MLIAEELLTLLCDQPRGYDITSAATATSDALVAEAALGGAFTINIIERKWGGVTNGVVDWSTDYSPTHPLLAEVYDAARRVPEKVHDCPASIVKKGLAADVSERVASQMVANGTLTRHDHQRLRFFKYTSWTITDPSSTASLRSRLTDALIVGREPDGRTAILGAFLGAFGCADRYVTRGSVSANEVRKRARYLSKATWAPNGLQDTLKDCLTAIGPDRSHSVDTSTMNL